MQIVELKVNVEKSQLTQLEAQIKALTSKQITIKVNTSGVDAKALNALTKYNQALAKEQAAKAKVIQANAKLAASNNKVTIAQAAAIKEANKTVQQQEKTRQAIQKTTQEQIKLERQVAKGQQAQERANRTMGNTATGISKASKEASGFQKLMGNSVGQIAAQMFMWQAMGAAVSVPIKAMKEAISTMKEVDSQLVQIQKVTNFSKTQMKEIEEQAYKTASAYGQSADSYLESVAAFARAGYKEQSADLGELAVKTMLVGDTTAEVADQFLLSVDKAYKYNGSVTELMKVLDGADYINNNFATSLEKIAEGMGIVAPVAAQAHVGVDELMASIGTITAVTQRSGSEAARALRALFLNIIGDTKTEIEDGAKWTAGEIEGLRDVLRTFVPDVVKAAEAANEVINPMEAIRALAEGMEKGIIQEDKLMEMVSDIGGKLRSSQLLAIIQNWDMYEQMLDSYQTAAGTADKEISYILDSWESKVNIMKNTWTEFISHMVNTDMIKGSLDGITSAIEFLDSDLGHAAISAAAFAAAFVGIGKAFAAVAGSNAISLATKFFAVLGEGGLVAALSKVAAFIGPLGMVAAAIGAIVAAPKIIDFFSTDYSEQAESLSKLNDEYESLFGTMGEFATLSEKESTGNLTQWEKNRLDYLRDYQKELDGTIQKEKEFAKQKYQQEYGGYDTDTTGDDFYRNGGKGRKAETVDVKNLREATRAFDALNKSALEGEKNQQDYRAGLESIIELYGEFYNATKEGLEAGILNEDDLTEAQRQLMELYETMQKLMEVPIEDLNVAVALKDFQGITEEGDKSVVSWSKLKQTMEEAGASAEDIAGTLAQLQANENIVLVDLEAEDNASPVIEGASQKADEFGRKKPNPTLKATDNATPVINGAVNALKNFVSKTITLTANFVTSGSGPGGGGWGSGRAGLEKATGDLHFNGGPVLLGDELSSDGSPRPELVITPGGKAFIAGMNGPVMTSLPGGSRIFKYSDTMDVLSGWDITGLNAYSKGNTAILDAFLNRGKAAPASSGSSSGGSSTSKSAGSSGSSGGGSSSAASATARARAKSGSSGKKSGSSGSGGGASGNYLEELKNQLALLRAQYDYLEASGAETADLVGKSQEIQGQLHVINEYLRETGGAEEDIVKNSTDWYKELEQIRKVQKEVYEKERDLYETEVELYEHQGKSVTVRVEKLRQIQDNLHREAEYLRSIKANQADINRLSIEWWEIQEKILSVQQDLMEEMDKAISLEIKQARVRRDEQISVLDKQIEALKKEREIQKDQLDIEEKRKRVEEARFALENAQNERNVRYYNSSTGQWEWGANASAVKSAGESLAQAEKELAEYERDQVLNKQIEELEAQKDAINEGFDSLESRWERLQESFEGPVRDIREILYDLLATGKLTDEQVNLIRGLVGDISGYASVISDAVTAIRSGAVATAANGQQYNIGSAAGLDFLNNAGAGSTMTGGDGSVWVKNADGSVTITKNGTSYTTGGSDTYTISSERGLDFLNTAPVGTTMIGGDGSVWKKNADGSTTISKNGSTYTVGGSGGGSSGSSAASTATATGKKKSGPVSKTDYASVNKGAAHQRTKARGYDSGGVLSGMGGIKATNADEIIIPPGVADHMLRPSAGSAFQARLSELGYLYGSTGRIPASLQNVSNRRSSNDHYGDSYSFGDVILTEQQARSTTVYQLAQMSRNLRNYKNA